MKQKVKLDKKKYALSDKYYVSLSDLFTQKGWEIEDYEGSVFNRFCNRLSRLEKDEERDFILELTGRYVWIKSDQYEDKLLYVLNKMTGSDWWKTIDKKKDVIFCPIKTENDAYKTKSSTFMLYLCRSIEASAVVSSKICHNPSAIMDINPDDIGQLIFVDDYIGTGLSFFDCFYGLFPSGCNYIEKVTLLCIAAQEEGINNIKREFPEIKCLYSEELLKKGISDYYPEEIDIKKEMMKNIENTLKIKSDYFGYKESEALVSLVRTPNNTFPFYWCETKTQDAPFARINGNEIIQKENESTK